MVEKLISFTYLRAGTMRKDMLSGSLGVWNGGGKNGGRRGQLAFSVAVGFGLYTVRI